MLSIEAIIRPETIEDVVGELEAVGCRKFYYANVTGTGRQGGVEVFVGRAGQMTRRHERPRTIVRAVIEDGMKDDVINAIIRGARSPGDGEVGDGKIFVTRVEDVIRVRTGETGEAAI